MKLLKRIQSTALLCGMLGSLLLPLPGAAADGFDGWWTPENGFSLDFNGTLSAYHNPEDCTDSSYPLVHDTKGACYIDVVSSDMDAERRGNSLQVTNSATPVSVLFKHGEAVQTESGVYRLRFSLAGGAASARLGASANLTDSINVARVTGGGSVRIGGDPNNGPVVCTVSNIAGSWVDFEEVINLNQKTIHWKVTQGETVQEGTISDITYADNSSIDSETPELIRFCVNQPVASKTPIYLDDLSLTPETEEEPEPDIPDPPSDSVLYSLDFEGETRESLIEQYGYNDNNRADALFGPRAEGDPHGDSLRVPKGLTSGSGYAFVFSTAEKGPKRSLSSGVYRFTFSLYPNGDTPVVGLDAGSASTYVALASISGGVVRSASIANTGSATALCTVDDDAWVDFETIVDLNTSRITYTVRQNGQVKADGITVPLLEHLGEAWSGVYRFSRLAVRTRLNAVNGFYFDDLKMEECTAFPTVAKGFVTFEDVLGNTVSGAAEDCTVMPTLQTITIDFGCPIDRNSVREITLHPEVPITKTVVENCCIIKPEEPLAGETEYTLSIPAAVSGTDGTALRKALSLSFFTEPTRTISVLGEITKDGTPVTDLSQLGVGDAFSLESSVINMSGTDMKCMPVVAYYQGGHMLATTCEPQILKNGQALEPISFTVPEAAAEMTALRCFLWDEMKGLTALCDAKELGEEIQIPSGDWNEESFMVQYRRMQGDVYIAGEAKDGSRMVLQALKSGKTFDSIPSEEDILYQNQSDAKAGRYFFCFEVDGKDSTGAHEAVLVSDKGERTALSLVLVTPEEFRAICQEINKTIQTENIEKLTALIHENIQKLGFDFPLIDDTIKTEELKDYMDYLKAHPLLPEQEDENCRIFKTHRTIYALNQGGLSNVDPFIGQLYLPDSQLLEIYKDLACSEDMQRYFTKRLSERPAHNLDEFETAFARALVYTGIRYGDGIADVRRVLTAYGAAVGITGTAPDRVYDNLLGKDFADDASLRKEYTRLNSNDTEPNTGNRTSGGRSGSSLGSRATNGYTVEPLEQEAPQPLAVTFQDIEGVEWAEEAILALANRGIINGTEPGVFRPNDPITREEFVKILVGAAQIGESFQETSAFSDVSKDAWYFPYVTAAFQYGLVQGMDDGTFGAGLPMTREDMVTMLYRALLLKKVEMPTDTLTFSDAEKISPYARSAVSALYKLGAVQGMTDNLFQPQGTSTRAQAAKVVYGVFAYLQNGGAA